MSKRIRRRHPLYGFDVLVGPEDESESLFMVPWERAPVSVKRTIKEARAAGLHVKAIVTPTGERIEFDKVQAEQSENVLTLKTWRQRHAC